MVFSYINERKNEMKITALEEYGLRCMLLLARSGNEGPLTISEIGSKEGLSVPYAGKLMMILKQAGLVKAVRGRRGGYVLARAPESVLLKEVFDALGEPVYSGRHCQRYTGEREQCVHHSDCNVRLMWSAFSQYIGGMLQQISLADMLNGNFNTLAGENLKFANENK